MHSALRATVHRLKSQICSTEQRSLPSVSTYTSSSLLSPVPLLHVSCSTSMWDLSPTLSLLTNIWNVFLSTWGIFLLLCTHWAHSYSSLNTPLKTTFSLIPSIAFNYCLLMALFWSSVKNVDPQSTIRSCLHDWSLPSIQLEAFPDLGPCLAYHCVPIG